VRALWKQHLEQGEVAGAMWAALTHKHGDKDTRQVVYADVHMLSHQIGAGQAADLRKLEWLQGEHASIKAENTALVNAAQAARQELADLRAALAARTEEVTRLASRVEFLESSQADVCSMPKRAPRKPPGRNNASRACAKRSASCVRTRCA
jgi:hypothetical protein